MASAPPAKYLSDLLCLGSQGDNVPKEPLHYEEGKTCMTVPFLTLTEDREQREAAGLKSHSSNLVTWVSLLHCPVIPQIQVPSLSSSKLWG